MACNLNMENNAGYANFLAVYWLKTKGNRRSMAKVFLALDASTSFCPRVTYNFP